jgi:serine/threonine-protein kinase HipA
MEALDLYLHDRHIGTVRRDRAKHRVVIEWDSAYEGNVPPLTVSFGVIPGRAPDAKLASNFLGGYTPEGNQRTALAAKRGIDPDDLYAILNEFGGSIAGAITLRDPEESSSYHPDYDELAERTRPISLNPDCSHVLRRSSTSSTAMNSLVTRGWRNFRARYARQAR